MQLMVDISLILVIFIFSYAFGRKSQSDNQPVIPTTVTWFSLFIIMGIYLLINLSSIINIMMAYSTR